MRTFTIIYILDFQFFTTAVNAFLTVRTVPADASTTIIATRKPRAARDAYAFELQIA